MSRISLRSAFLLALLIALLPTLPSYAASSHIATSGITVSPGELAFQLIASTDNQTLPLTITNNYNASVSLTAEFKGIDENTNLLIPSGALDPDFASALSISETNITLPAHATRVLNVQATNLNALSPGGHYATLMLTQQDASGAPLSIKGAVSLTIFVVKDPGSYKSMVLNSVTTNHNLFKLPTTATLSFTNNGNVLLVPRATIFVFDSGGAGLLKKGVVNEASFPLLPGKKFQTVATVKPLGSVWLPQRVQLEVTYRPDGVSQLSIATASFWYIPPSFLVTMALLVGFIIWRVVQRRRSGRRAVPASLSSISLSTSKVMEAIRAMPRRIAVSGNTSKTTVKVGVKPRVEVIRPRSAAKTTLKRKR